MAATEPTLLMLDEPSMGIMPKLITEIFEMIQKINREEFFPVLICELDNLTCIFLSYTINFNER